MTDTLRKHSVTLAGHRTSFTLEEPFWEELRRLARQQGRSVRDLVEAIDTNRSGNLSSAIRVYVLEALRAERDLETLRAERDLETLRAERDASGKQEP